MSSIGGSDSLSQASKSRGGGYTGALGALENALARERGRVDSQGVEVEDADALSDQHFDNRTGGMVQMFSSPQHDSGTK